MKKILMAILFVGYLPTLSSAQDPCAGRKYAFEFINPSTCQEEYDCADNPDTYSTSLVPVRWAPGATIFYQTQDIGQPCVDANALNQCIDAAFCAWTSLAACANIIAPYAVNAKRADANTNPRDIVLIRGYSGNDVTGKNSDGSPHHEFGDNNYDVSQVIAVTSTIPLCSGHIIAKYSLTDRSKQSWIDINTTSTFVGASSDVYPCPSSSPNCQNHPTDICKAIAHEIGHLMGLNHTTPSPSETSYLPNCGWSSPQDLMAPYAEPCDGQAPQWTTNDCCMMHKLYCDNNGPMNCPPSFSCNTSRVDDKSFVPTFDPGLALYPNPTTGTLNIQFNSDVVGLVTLCVYDELGHQLVMSTYKEGQGRAIHSISLSTLPSGNYIVRIVGTNLRGSKVIKLIGR